MFFPDKDRSYAEVFRILKPGGAYLFNLWDSWDANPFARIAQEAVEALFPEDPHGFYRVPFGYHDEVEIEAAVRRAGFDQITIERLPIVSKIQTAEAFAQGLVYGNPLFDEIVSRGGDPEEAKTELARRIDGELGGEMPLQAVFVTAVKP